MNSSTSSSACLVWHKLLQRVLASVSNCTPGIYIHIYIYIFEDNYNNGNNSNSSNVLWYGLGRPVITSEIGNWSVFVLLGWRFVFGIIMK